MQALSKKYPIWFCDIWGVVHDGVVPFASAVSCLVKHRLAGGCVILVSNSPNTSASVQKHLDEIGVNENAYDALVTSGDVTKALIVEYGGTSVFHIGTARDYSIFEGLNVKRVDEAHAQSVMCSGLFHEQVEKPEDYTRVLSRLKERDLPFICANPDKVVRRGNQLIPCAGALAEIYSDLGGKVYMAGKPFKPIYDLALAKAQKLRTQAVHHSEILAIGDGPETDVKGAVNFDVPVVLITSGINSGAGVASKVAHTYPQAKILASMAELDWTA